MPTPLLSVKLKIPLLRSTLVLRPHLIEKLNVGLNCKLSLISAPAGYGKTTLLCCWARSCQRPTAWISLDEGDNEPGRFFHYLAAAIQQIQPNLGDVALAMVSSRRAIQVETALTSLLNDIASMSTAAILILDDYHTISNQRVHDNVTFLLEHLPPQLHIAISTRSDPPLPIARLRAHEELTELRQNDLRFSAGETAQFLTKFLPLQLSAVDINALVSRTEGWIAGLQMAALSLQHQQDASDFIAKFTGSQHHVLDYLVEEVLARQPESVQTFLLQTSILERMSGALCDEVIINLTPASSKRKRQEISGQAMLEHLEHANLFVFPLDEDLHWYRYHHLFAECLRQRLCLTAPQLVPELHRRAANWCRHNGCAVEAVNHLLAAGDWGEAAQLVEQHAMQMFVQSEMSTLSAWLDRLPDNIIRHRPWLCVLRAWVYTTGRHESIESCLQAAEQALEQQQQSAKSTEEAPWVPSENQLRAHMSLIRAVQAAAADDSALASDLARRALDQLPGDHYERVLVALILGWAARSRGDLESSNQSYAEARRVGLATGSTQAAISAICCLGDNQVLQGQLRKAAESYQEALRLSVSCQTQGSAAAGYALIRLGDVHREWNNLESALRHVVDGIDLCRTGGYSSNWVVGFVTLARLRLAHNNLAEARAALQNAQQLTRVSMGDFVVRYSVQDCQVRLWLACDDVAAAVEWRHTSGSDGTDEACISRELEHLTRARVLIAQSRIGPDGSNLAAAVSLLTRVLDVTESIGWTAFAIEAMILKALVLHLEGHVEQALTVLTRVLTLAEPEGYARVFIDEGAPMAQLLRQVTAPSRAAECADRLLAMFDTRGTELGQRAEARDPVQGPNQIKKATGLLSEREFDILRLLPTVLSGPAIASELCLSANTVRTHIRHIYGKLDVHSRYEAVLRAKELELI